MASKLAILVVLAVCCYVAQSVRVRPNEDATETVSIPINDKNIYFTPLNWYRDPQGKYAQTANPGAYFKVEFTGTQVRL
jgi:hypothetical protein